MLDLVYETKISDKEYRHLAPPSCVDGSSWMVDFD